MTFLEWVAENKGFCAFVLILFVFVVIPLVGETISGIIDACKGDD